MTDDPFASAFDKADPNNKLFGIGYWLVTERDAEAIRNAPNGKIIAVQDKPTLRTQLISRLGEERYRLMYLAACDFFGLPLDFDDEFIDRCLADELNMTESECAA